MPWIVEKMSIPCWEKSFDSKDAARAELLKHICGACLAGGEWEGFDENGITKGIIPGENPPDQNNTRDLLSTPCGCEYSVNPEFREFSSRPLKTEEGR